MTHQLRILSLLFFFVVTGPALAGHASNSLSAAETAKPECGTLECWVTAALADRWPGTQIKLQGAIQWEEPQRIAEELATDRPVEVQVITDQQNGFASVGFKGIQGRVGYSAMKSSYIPRRRIVPGQPLDPQDFDTRDVDVSTAANRVNRGLILGTNITISGLESRQTLLEGQPVLTTAVQKLPDVRRGDHLQVEVVLGDIVLSTRAEATENGLKGSRLRALTEKQKREVVGTLRNDGVLEVRL